MKSLMWYSFLVMRRLAVISLSLAIIMLLLQIIPQQTRLLAQLDQIQNGLDLFQVRRLIINLYPLMQKPLKTLLAMDIIP